MSNSPGGLPKHVAVIMDGNGRWAQQRGLPRSSGHQAGVKATRQVVEACARLGIESLTVFAFSSENWRRPETEVRFLLDLFGRALRAEVGKLHKNNIRVRFVGNLAEFPAGLQDEIRNAESKTDGNAGMRLNIAVNYGGRWELVNAARKLAEKVAQGQLSPEQIDQQLLTRHCCFSEDAEPDLFIRTGGEKRLSNYLLWHLAYTELVFTDTLWPDFDADELHQAIAQFSARERRYGQTGEQVRVSSQDA